MRARDMRRARPATWEEYQRLRRRYLMGLEMAAPLRPSQEARDAYAAERLRDGTEPHPSKPKPTNEGPAADPHADMTPDGVDVAALVAAEQAWGNFEGGNVPPKWRTEDMTDDEVRELVRAEVARQLAEASVSQETETEAPASDGGEEAPTEDAGSDETPTEAHQDAQEPAGASQDAADAAQPVMTREAAMKLTAAKLQAYAVEQGQPEPKGQKATIVDTLVAAGLVQE